MCNYTKATDETELKIHDLYLRLKTPIPLVPKIDFHGNVEMDEHLSRGNVTIKTVTTDLSFAGSLEVHFFLNNLKNRNNS